MKSLVYNVRIHKIKTAKHWVVRPSVTINQSFLSHIVQARLVFSDTQGWVSDTSFSSLFDHTVRFSLYDGFGWVFFVRHSC